MSRRNTSLRIIQVGMGGFGRSWASEVVPEVDGAELVACVDVDPASIERARALTSLPEDRYFRSLEDALQRVPCDAVLITTVLAAHVPVAMAAIDAGKHVLVEKPFAPTLAEAHSTVEAAKERGLVLMVSQNYRFFPAVRAVQDIVATGEFGELSGIYVDFRKYDNKAPRGKHLHYLVPQPILVDMAIHHFDLMRAIFPQEPTEIHCHSWNPPWSKYDEPPEAVATVTFDGGAVVSYRGTWLSPGDDTQWAGTWRMEFSEGEVSWTSRIGGEIPDTADSVVVRPLGEEPQPRALTPLRYVDRAGSLNAFVEAVRTESEPETSGRRNINTLALTFAAVESAATGVPVRL